MLLTRRFFSFLPLGAVLASGLAKAQPLTSGAVSVIELFTSQGCSSCPPADAMMLEMAGKPGIVALTYPVEIWDYLGWKDTLAQPAFTRRQKAYATMVAGKRVYTPQAIVNGRAHCVGSDGSALARLKATTARETGLRVVVESTDRGWMARVLVPPGGVHDARLLLLPIASRRTAQIGRGENSGRSVTYANVVRDVIDLGLVDTGDRRFPITRQQVAVDGADAYALVVQSGTLDAPAAIHAAILVPGA